MLETGWARSAEAFDACVDMGTVSNRSKSRMQVLEEWDMENRELGGTSDKVLIRELRKSDLNDLLGLLPMCFAEEFAVSGFDPDHMTEMFNRAFGTTGRFFLGLMRLFGREPMKFLVAEADGKVVGSTIVSGRGKVGYVSTVMVHPDYRRKGIATRLVTDALSYVRKRKLERAILDVNSTNASARSLYVKLGFKTFEHLAFYVGETHSKYALENASGVKIREFQKADLNEVFNLIKASEDANSLRIFDFTKKDLKVPFLQRVFSFGTQKKLVVVLGGRIVGYVEVSYTTPKETGRISSINVNPDDGSIGIDKLLIEAANNEIAEGNVGKIRIAVSTAKQQLVETVKDLGFREVFLMEVMVKELQ